MGRSGGPRLQPGARRLQAGTTACLQRPFRIAEQEAACSLQRSRAGGGRTRARRRRMAQEPRSLVQHLSDQAGLCVTDCARLARVACNDSRVEVRAASPQARLMLVSTTAVPYGR